jgi:hypothetical protein
MMNGPLEKNAAFPRHPAQIGRGIDRKPFGTL